MGFKLFDKYLFKKMFVFFFEGYGMLLVLYALVDLLFGQDLASPKSLVEYGRFFLYYFLSFHRLVGNFLPTVLFAAAGATLYSIDERHELIALKTMGASPARILAPLCVCAVFLSMALGLVRETVLPRFVTLLPASRNDFIKRPTENNVFRFQDDAGGLVFFGFKYNQNKDEVTNPEIIIKNSLCKFNATVCAASARYLPAENERPAGWLLSSVATPIDLLRNPSVQNPVTGQTLIYSPSDTPWLKEKESFIVSDVTPKHLLAGNDWVANGNLFELLAACKNPTFESKRCDLVIKVQCRIHSFLTDLAPFFLGAPFYLLLGASNKSMEKFGKSFILAFSFSGGQFLLQGVGTMLKIPVVAVCGPLFFMPVVICVYLRLWSREI